MGTSQEWSTSKSFYRYRELRGHVIFAVSRMTRHPISNNGGAGTGAETPYYLGHSCPRSVKLRSRALSLNGVHAVNIHRMLRNDFQIELLCG